MVDGKPVSALLEDERWLARGRLAGTLPAALAQEPPVLALLAAAVLLLAAGEVGGGPPRVARAFAWGVALAWMLLAVGNAVYIAACRRRSRAVGLRVLLVVPEGISLLRWCYRRLRVAVPAGRRWVFTVHVDDRWRPHQRDPAAAAREFAAAYRQDYDWLLAGLAGHPVLVSSSTYNRHESPWTERARGEGWCSSVAGPMFRGAPRRHGPRARAQEQRRIFGGLVTERRVDVASAWRTRLFDCAGAADWRCARCRDFAQGSAAVR